MKILDMCCGSKMFWYEKHEPHTTYMDIRKATYTAKDRGKVRKIEVNPDIQADWKNIPFDDATFDLIVFDPPHLMHAGKRSWLAKKYGVLDDSEGLLDIKLGFREAMRVLKPTGTLPCFLHVCGGDPEKVNFANYDSPFSPRMWR